MSKVRTFSYMAGAVLALCTAGSLAQAAVTPHIQTTGRPNTRAEAKAERTRSAAAPVTLTQNVDPNTIQDGVSVACSAGGVTTSNTWMRRFDLDGQHGITGPFCATSVDFGVELLTGGTQLTVATHCYNANTPGVIDLGQLATQDSVSFAGADGSLYFQNTAVTGCCTGATDDMVVEVTGADCLGSGACLQFFIGANSLGQTGPGYIGAVDCGINNPTDISLIGFPNDHIVLSVNGDADVPGTPAIGPLGIMVLVLSLLGGSAIFLRRQVIG